MGHRIVVESAQAEVGCFIHKASIFGPQREVLAQKEVCATTVNESSPRLTVGTRHECVSGWVKHKGAAFGQHIWIQPETSGTGQAEDQSTRCLVDISLYP